MTDGAGIPTVPVLLRGHVDTFSHTGRPSRIDLVVEGEVEDRRGSPPPIFAKLRTSESATPTDYRSFNGRILVPRPDGWDKSAELHLPSYYRPRKDAVVFRDTEFEPYQEASALLRGRHDVTGDNRFDWNIGVLVIDGRRRVVQGRDLPGIYDLAGADAVADRLRRDARAGMILLEDGFHVSWHLPRWQIKADRRDRGRWSMELADYSARPEALSYRADRLEHASAKLRQLDPEGRIAGGVLEWHPEHAPVLVDDAERLAAHAVPELAKRHDLTAESVERRLIGEWHDAYNGSSVVAREGISGAARVLGAGLLLMDSLRLRERDVPEDLYARILEEGVPHPEAAPLLRGVAP